MPCHEVVIYEVHTNHQSPITITITITITTSIDVELTCTSLPLEVELTTVQKQYYRALYEKNVQFLHRNKKKPLDGPSLNNLAMQLRKSCNHAFLLNGVEEEIRGQERKAGSAMSEGDFLVKCSGKLVLLDKLLPRLQSNGHRVLIFSQFKIMLDIIEDFLHERKFKAERIDGSITGKKRQTAIDRFQSPAADGKEAPFVMMLSTRAGGVGINLTARRRPSSEFVIILGIQLSMTP